MKDEPAITINGIPLTTGQAMTVRVACSHFFMSLEPSEKIDTAYKARLEEVFKMMIGSPASTRKA